MSNAIKWGGIMAIGIIIMTLVFHVLGLSEPDNSMGSVLTTLLSYAISIGALVMGILAYKKANDDYLTIGNGIVQGLLIALIGGLLIAIFSFVYYSFVDPALLERMKEASLSQSTGDENQDEMMESMMDIMFSPASLAGITVFMKLCLGFFVGLIAGAVFKNESPNFNNTLDTNL